MATIPTYTAQAVSGVPQLQDPNFGSTSPMASPSSFYTGGAEGLNLQPLISGVNQAADVLDRLDIQKEKAWTTDTVLKARMHWMETFADPEKAPEPEQYRKQFEAYEKSVLKAAPSGRARDYATVQLNELGLSMLDNATRTSLMRRERERATLQQSVSTQVVAQAEPLPIDQVFPFIAKHGEMGGLSKPRINMLYDQVSAAQATNPVIASQVLEYADANGQKLPFRDVEKSQEFIAKSAATVGTVAIMGTPEATSSQIANDFIKKYPLAAPAITKAREDNLNLMRTDSAGWASSQRNLSIMKQDVDTKRMAWLKAPQDQSALAAYQQNNQIYLDSRAQYQEQTLGYSTMLSNDEVKVESDNLNAAKSPRETMQKLNMMPMSTPSKEQGERILNEVITRGKVSPTTMVMATNMSNPWLPEVLAREGIPITDTEFKVLQKQVRDNTVMMDYQASLVVSGVQAVNAADSFSMGVATAAAKSIGFRDGYTQSTAAKMAVDELANRYTFLPQREGVKVRIPTALGMKAGDIQMGLDLAKTKVAWMNPSEAGRNIQNSVWVTTPDNKGVQLYFYGKGYPVPVEARTPNPAPKNDDERKKGLPIVKTWQEVQVKGGAALIGTRGLF